MSTAVLGGGIGGLSAAFYLINRFAGRPTTLYEASNRIGGWIRTEHLKAKKSNKEFRFEAGPHTLRPKGIPGANTLELIEKINLPINGIPSKHVAAKNRMIYAHGKLCLLPNSMASIFRKRAPFSKPLISALFHDLFANSTRSKVNDESIYEFCKRRFGAEVATYAISSMICGICAGNAKDISVRFLMNDLYDIEQQYGGVAKGLFLSKLFNKEKPRNETPSSALYEEAKSKKWSMYIPVDGMEALPTTLAAYLKTHDVNIQLSSECKEINFDRRGAIMNINDKEVRADHVISSLPSFKLSPCVRNLHPALADQLLEIPYVDVAVVSLQFNSDILNLKAFGFLVPPVERLPILGIIFNSCCIDMHGNTVLTVMMGGHWFEEYFGRNPTQKQLLDTALVHIRNILKIEEQPDKVRVHILNKCIPQYTVGHKERVANIRKYISSYKLPLSLCGAAYDGVGINDAILSARRQVETLLQ